MDFGIKKKKKIIKPDKSDFSTQTTKPNVSDFANKNKFKPKVKVKDTSGKFSSDAGVKPSVNTFSADTNLAKNTNKDKSDFAGGKTTKINKTKKVDNKTTKPTSFGAAFRAARAKQGAGGVFTYKGKKFSTNKKSDKKVDKKVDKKTKKVVKKKVSAKASNDAQSTQKVISKKTRTDFKKSGAFKGIDSAPGDNKKPKIKRKSTSNIIGNKNFVSDKKKKNKLPKQLST